METAKRYKYLEASKPKGAVDFSRIS